DELQEAISAHAAREQTAEYSDDFESDEDGILNGIGEEFNESSSGAESTKKSFAVESPFSDDDASQKAEDLENEAADDLALSFHEKKLQQIMLSESENLQDDRKDDEEKSLENQNEGDDRKNNEECSAAEELLCDNSESDRYKNLPMPELQKNRNEEENKPIPKPRVHKTRNASASGDILFKSQVQNLSVISITFYMCLSPMKNTMKVVFLTQIVMQTSLVVCTMTEELVLVQYRTILRKKYSCYFVLSIFFLLLDKDQKKISTSDLKLEDNGRKSPSVIEVTMTTVYEKTKKLEKSTDASSDETVNIVEGQIVTDTIQEVSMNDQSEPGEAMNTLKSEHYLVSATINGKIINMFVSWYFYSSLSSVHLKKKAKAVPSARPVSSQYLGTLKVLEDKHEQKNSTGFDKADSLRASVFQNWLEKKRSFLLEVKRIEKKKAESLRNEAEKKEAVKREEATASFEAWKKKKGIEAKKLSEKKKLEELKKNKAAEQSEEKTEAAQKAFEKWKERKMEYLREQRRKEKQSERIRKKKEEELAAERKRDSMSAFEKWKEKKEEYIKEKKAEKILERKKQEIQQTKKEERNKKATEEYERWLEKKEQREQLEKKQKKLQAVHGDEAPSPWSPPGKISY
ncbi:MAP9 protein, partial [Geococcyx californianus]|nr:MAP9 protein [Geococcyx californianus]